MKISYQLMFVLLYCDSLFNRLDQLFTINHKCFSASVVVVTSYKHRETYFSVHFMCVFKFSGVFNKTENEQRPLVQLCSKIVCFAQTCVKILYIF